MATTQTKQTHDTSIADAVTKAADGVSALGERASAGSRKATLAYLEAYDQAVLRATDSYAKVAGTTKIGWIGSVATLQAEVVRDVSRVYTSAARELVV